MQDTLRIEHHGAVIDGAVREAFIQPPLHDVEQAKLQPLTRSMKSVTIKVMTDRLPLVLQRLIIFCYRRLELRVHRDLVAESECAHLGHGIP
jgi:hypothetical protein